MPSEVAESAGGTLSMRDRPHIPNAPPAEKPNTNSTNITHSYHTMKDNTVKC